jgi:hypothetical protein
LSDQQEALQVRLQTLRQTGQDAWQDLRSGIDQALKNLTDGIENAFSRFQLKTE